MGMRVVARLPVWVCAMALMAGVWWLYAFVRVMQERDWRWLAVAVVAGSVSALVKGAVYAVWLVPGAAYGAWVLWRGGM